MLWGKSLKHCTSQFIFKCLNYLPSHPLPCNCCLSYPTPVHYYTKLLDKIELWEVNTHISVRSSCWLQGFWVWPQEPFCRGCFRVNISIVHKHIGWLWGKKKKKERRQGKSSELTQLNICCKHALTSYGWNLTTYLNIRSLPWLWLVNLTKSSMSRAEQVVPVGFKSDKWSLTLISGWHKVAHWWNTPRCAI